MPRNLPEGTVPTVAYGYNRTKHGKRYHNYNRIIEWENMGDFTSVYGFLTVQTW